MHCSVVCHLLTALDCLIRCAICRAMHCNPKLLAGGSCSNSVQHNQVHRNLLPWPTPPKDPRLPKVPTCFPGDSFDFFNKMCLPSNKQHSVIRNILFLLQFINLSFFIFHSRKILIFATTNLSKIPALHISFSFSSR